MKKKLTLSLSEYEKMKDRIEELEEIVDWYEDKIDKVVLDDSETEKMQDMIGVVMGVKLDAEVLDELLGVKAKVNDWVGLKRVRRKYIVVNQEG